MKKNLMTNDTDDTRRESNYSNKQRGTFSCTAITSSAYLSHIPTAEAMAHRPQ